jgi:hypothetical protein
MLVDSSLLMPAEFRQQVGALLELRGLHLVGSPLLLPSLHHWGSPSVGQDQGPPALGIATRNYQGFS